MNQVPSCTTNDATTRPPRPGLTLLEVLVACGILVMGLASVAALLPAAASVLSEASATDRAGTLAANAAAELSFRGTLKATEFTSAIRILVVGNALPNPPFLGNAPFKRIDVAPTAADEQAYGTSWFGATVTPLAAGVPARQGDSARVTVVAFKRANPESKAVSLSNQSADGQALPPGVFRLDGGSPSQREADRKRFLPPCGWSVNVTGSTVRWLHVGSSWATYGPGGTEVKECFVSFSDPDGATAAASGNSLTVYGFAGVLRIEERIVSLD
jgi:Tfp pilus assembly protein PilV